jgi:hypothetical protein
MYRREFYRGSALTGQHQKRASHDPITVISARKPRAEFYTTTAFRTNFHHLAFALHPATLIDQMITTEELQVLNDLQFGAVLQFPGLLHPKKRLCGLEN